MQHQSGHGVGCAQGELLMRRPPRRGEEGAVLLLAVIFIIVISLVLVALLNLTGNQFRTTSTLISAQTVQYAASGAANVALENVQYTDLALPMYPAQPANCLPSSPLVPLANGPQMWATCSLGPVQSYGPWNVPGSVYGPYTRQLYIFACQTNSPSCGATGSVPTVTAVVELVDDATCAPTSVAGCGQQAIIESWQNANP
jgi:type II secretory pathway pseudopilin PulG